MTLPLGYVYPIAITLFYYDQRIRLEGYDIERMMAAAGLNPTAPPTPRRSRRVLERPGLHHPGGPRVSRSPALLLLALLASPAARAATQPVAAPAPASQPGKP